jgi:DNA-binding transcriptional MerR regulator
LTLESTPRFTVATVATRRISETAAEAGVSSDTLRYYERIGLISPAERAPSGYRRYDALAAERVRFIKGAQRMGLRLTDIRDLLEIRDRGACPCGHTRGLLVQRLNSVNEQLCHLRALRHDLVEMLDGLDGCPAPPAGTWWCETEFTKKGGEPDDVRTVP